MKKTVCLLLVFVMLALALASCGKKSSDATTADATTAASTTAGSATAAATTAEPTAAGSSDATAPETTAPETTALDTTASVTTESVTMAPQTTRFDRLDEIVGLSAADRSLRIQLSGWGDAEKVSKNDKYIAGPDQIVEGATTMIEQLVYNRNHAANELLTTSVEYVYWTDLQWGSQSGRINTLVQGNAADAPDLFVDMIYDLGLSTMNGVFKDVWSIPGSFFDFDAAGWMTEWMESMSLTGDRAYTLAGDYFIDVLRAMTVLPFNMTMMDENAAKLAPAVLGDDEKLGAGEALTTYFFDLVEEGSWTWDVLGKLSAAIWLDVDNSGNDSIGDRLGFIGSGRTNMSSSMYLYSNSEKLFDVKVIEDQSDPNYGKRWIYYADMGGLGDIFDAVEAVFSGEGTLAPDFPNDGNTPENPGLAYHWIKFGQGETLFAGACVLGAMEDDAFQQMTDLYSVVPMPKVHVEGDYNTVIHNVGDAGAMNVNVNPRKAKVLSAFLQYCTENSGEIRDEFLQIVTKYKTTTYNQGTDRMLDIVYNSVINGRDKSIEDIMGTNSTCKPLRWHVLLKDGNQYTHDSSFISSRYESAVAAKQAYLNEKLEVWYTLPKVDPAAE